MMLSIVFHDLLRGVRIYSCVLNELVWQRTGPPQFVVFPLHLLLHAFLEWVDDAACNIGQGVIVFGGLWIFPLALHVDEVVGVDFQARLSKLPLVTSNAETDKCVQFLRLQELFEALGPTRGATHTED